MITFGDSRSQGKRHESPGDTAGTFRVYDGAVLVGYVLTVPEPGEGPHWTRPLGRQGRTVKGASAAWSGTSDGAVAALLEAYRAEG